MTSREGVLTSREGVMTSRYTVININSERTDMNAGMELFQTL